MGAYKILHVLGSMNRGGVETWLMHVLRHINKNKFELHFLVHTRAEAAFDQEILCLGGHIHYGGSPKNPSRYASRFSAIVGEHGPFDVVHSHVYWYSGYIMLLARNAGIPIRIAHSHAATSAAAWSTLRRLYQELMRAWIMRYATHRICISHQAGEALFGSRPKKSINLLHYGFDFSRFLQVDCPGDLKRRLGIPPDRKVIGQIGRLVPIKNHAFTVKIFASIVARGEDVHLLLVGDGPLLSAVRSLVESRGLSGRCTFAGSQDDVAPFFRTMDVLVLPSNSEGLGIVALESQAAGVPVIASTGVTREIDVVPDMVEHIPLSAGAADWALAVGRRLEEPKPRPRDGVLQIERSFGLQHCLETLSAIYSGVA